MFTGLIEEVGVIQQLQKGADSARLTVAASRVLEELKLGDSIAVNGVCLTVTKYEDRTFTVDIMAETLNKTNFSQLGRGSRVNLERALRLGDRLGGHLVSGHIDGLGTVAAIEQHDIALLLTIKGPPQVLRFVVPKGSIAINGVSLTVVNCDESSFFVSLIPHTAGGTNLGSVKIGDLLNLEADMLAKYVERILDFRSGQKREDEQRGISMEFLSGHGYL